MNSLLITDFSNIFYLTGLRLSAGCILATKSGYFLFVDQRYGEAALKIAGKNASVRPIGEFDAAIAKLPHVGFEAENLTVGYLERFRKKFPKTLFSPTSDVIEDFRREKFADELAAIRHASRITRLVLDRIPSMLSFGVTESRLAAEIEAMCRKKGAEGMAFETIVGFGEHTARPHHRPTDRKLRKGDVVQIDMGAKHSGYCSDFSRVFFTAEATSMQKKVMKALVSATIAARKILRVGITNRQLDEAARAALSGFGFDKEFPHALGHGVGIDIHEGPTLSSRAPEKTLLKNEVVTIEPGLYFEGEWGMRIEDTIIV